MENIAHIYMSCILYTIHGKYTNAYSFTFGVIILLILFFVFATGGRGEGQEELSDLGDAEIPKYLDTP